MPTVKVKDKKLRKAQYRIQVQQTFFYLSIVNLSKQPLKDVVQLYTSTRVPVHVYVVHTCIHIFINLIY